MGKPRVTEREFQNQVLQFAKLHGWRTAHFRPAMMRDGSWVTAVQGDGKGFPDTVLVRGNRLIFAELKSGRWKSEMKPEPAQQAWLESLEATEAEVYLWTPADWKSIEEVLA